MSATPAVILFLCILPFLYPAQVFTMRNDFVPLPYAVLFAIVVATFCTTRPVDISRRRGASLLDLLIGSYMLLNIPWVVFEWLWTGFLDGVRVFIYFVVPPLLYFVVSRYATPAQLQRFPPVLGWTAAAVALELFFEKYYNFILLSTSPFQIRNYDYVSQVGSGTELPQLANTLYRTPGMLEHVHATATYLGMGTIAALYLCLQYRSKMRLLVLAVNASALVVSGGRTALLSTLVAGIFLITARRSWLPAPVIPSRLRRVSAPPRSGGLAAASVVVIGAFLLSLTYEPVRRIYVEMFTGQLIGGGVSFFGEVVPVEIELWWKAVGEVPLAVPFGLGPGPGSLRAKLGMGSDDFFPVDILGRYGVVGFLVFYITPLVLIGEVIYTLKRERGRLRQDTALLLLFSGATIVLLMLTTLHSGAIVRKAIYPWLFVAYGIGRHYLAPVPVTHPDELPHGLEPVPDASPRIQM